MKTVGGAAFCDAELTEVTVCEGVQKIGSLAFGSTKLTRIRLPESLRTLDVRAFAGCKELKEINLPLGLKTLPHRVFQLTALEGLKQKDGWLLEAENTAHYTIPAGIRKVAEGAFETCESLRQLTVSGHEVDLDSVWLGFKSCLNRLQRLNRITAPEYTLEECPEQLLPYVLTGWMADHWNGTPLAQSPEAAYAAARASMEADTMGLWKRLFSCWREALYDAIKGGAIPVALADVLLEEKREDKELVLALLNYKNTAAAAEAVSEALELSEEPEESVGLCLTKKEASRLWTVKKLDDGTWRVSAYKGTDTVMVIPAYIDDEPVSEVGKSPKAGGKMELLTITGKNTAIEDDANFLRNNRKAVLRIHRGNTKVMEYLSDSKRKVEFL